LIWVLLTDDDEEGLVLAVIELVAPVIVLVVPVIVLVVPVIVLVVPVVVPVGAIIPVDELETGVGMVADRA